MERNVGGADKTARIVLGVALGVVAMAAILWGDGLATTNLIAAGVTLLLAVVLLATASAETCPVNAAVGRDTYRGGR